MGKATWDQTPDADLVRRASVDASAFAELHRRYAKRVFGLLVTLRLDAETANDVSQQTWLKAYEKLARKPADSPFDRWLMQIARHTAIDHVRRKKLVALPDDEVLSGHDPRDVLADVEENNDMERLRGCMAKLPEQERTIVQRRLQGFDAPAIAATLGLTSERVHRLYHEAKAKLQHCLGVSS